MDDGDEIVYLSSEEQDKRPGNKRTQERIAHVFDIKFSPAKGAEKWDVANIRNLSKGGIMFYAADYYAPGFLLKVIIGNPFNPLRTPSMTRVMRCTPVEKVGGLYQMVIDTTMLDEGIKKALYETIDTILENKKKYYES